MGNNHSSSEEDKEQTYTYHEDVLRNAQHLATGINRDGTDIPVYESDNENEYFSAEEGDSDRSVTPPRTRPESSSGEDSSDASDDQNQDSEMDVSSHAQVTASQSNTSVTDPSSGRCEVPSNNRTCGRCNVSLFQEYDSISPELETSRWHLSDSSVTSNRMSSKRHNCMPSASQFVPIHSPPGSCNVSHKGDNSNSISSALSKRKSSQMPETDGEPPKKRYSNEVSPFKRGFGYFDSSDSDDDLGDSTRRRRTRHSRSPKSAKLTKCATTPGSKRGLLDSKDIDINSSTSPKRRRVIDRKALGEVISESAKRSHSGDQIEWEGKMKKIRGQCGIFGGRSREDYENKFGLHENSPHLSRSENTVFSPLKKRLRSSIFQPHTHVDAGDPGRASEEKNLLRETTKMGKNCARNSLGKLIPLRGQSDPNQLLGMVSQTKTSISNRGSSPSSNDDENLRDRTSFGNDEISINGGLKRKSNDTFSPVQNSQSLDNPLTKNREAFIQLERVCESSNPESEREITHNPFVNVVLTPDNSDSSISKTHITQLADNDTSSPRAFITATKRAKQSPAERLKKFWTEGRLRTNLKSIFSPKSKTTPDRSTRSPDMDANPSDMSSTSFNAALQSQSNHLFNDSSHMHFASSPADTHSPRLVASVSSPTHQRNRVGDGSSSSAMNLNSVSPIFASLPALSSISDSSLDTENHRYSSILGMSARAQKRVGSPYETASHNQVSTRRSSRLQSSSSNKVAAIQPMKSMSPLPSSDVIQILPQRSKFQVLHFRLGGTLDISISMGDIASETSAGIVNWTDESLTHTVTECSRRISAKAGALMRAGCADYLTNKGSLLEAPDVLTTPAGGRFPKSVEALLHVVTPQLRRGEKATHAMTNRLLDVYANCLRFANERLGLQSLSLPLIGEDLFTTEVSIKAFFDSILIFLTEGKHLKSSHLQVSSAPFDLASISLVISDVSTTDLATELINVILHRINRDGLEMVAKEIYSSHYGHGDSPASDREENADRAKSGRPRVKRPKL